MCDVVVQLLLFIAWSSADSTNMRISAVLQCLFWTHKQVSQKVSVLRTHKKLSVTRAVALSPPVVLPAAAAAAAAAAGARDQKL